MDGTNKNKELVKDVCREWISQLIQSLVNTGHSKEQISELLHELINEFDQLNEE